MKKSWQGRDAGNLENSLLQCVRRDFIAAGFTLRNIKADFSEWHRGRPYFLLWALDVDLSPVRERVAAAVRHLDGLLLSDYRRQPHVTLGLCGFPHAAEHGWQADAYTVAQWLSQIEALREATPGVFSIDIGTLASFTSAPFLQVSDTHGGIAVLRRCLADRDINHPDGPYVPHVTVGLYRDAWPSGPLGERLDVFNDGSPIRCRIEQVTLMCYASEDIGGMLYRLVEMDLYDGGLYNVAPRMIAEHPVWQPFLQGLPLRKEKTGRTAEKTARRPG